MHELSIALGILDRVAEEAERHGATRVLAVHMKLGVFSGVVKEALLSAYNLARENTDLQDAELRIEEVPLQVHCPACAATRDVVSLQQLSCRQCGAPTPELISGRELEITALEIQ